MRAFRFSLQRVLDVKRIREEQRRQAVAQAQAEAEACAQQLEEANEALLEAVAGGVGGAFDPVLRSLGWHHRTVLHDRAVQLQEQLAERNRVLAQVRSDLVVAVKERKALERLRERRRAVYEQEEARRAQASLDDLAGARALRMESGDAGLREG